MVQVPATRDNESRHPDKLLSDAVRSTAVERWCTSLPQGVSNPIGLCHKRQELRHPHPHLRDPIGLCHKRQGVKGS